MRVIVGIRIGMLVQAEVLILSLRMGAFYTDFSTTSRISCFAVNLKPAPLVGRFLARFRILTVNISTSMCFVPHHSLFGTALAQCICTVGAFDCEYLGGYKTRKKKKSLFKNHFCCGTRSLCMR